MNDRNKYYIIGTVGLVLLLIIALIAVSGEKNTSEAPIDNNYQSMPETDSGSSEAPAYTGQENEEYVAPVYTKKIDLDLMTEEEKIAIGIDPSILVQVLSRAETGEITAYRVMADQNDLLEYYGN